MAKIILKTGHGQTLTGQDFKRLRGQCFKRPRGQDVTFIQLVLMAKKQFEKVKARSLTPSQDQGQDMACNGKDYQWI